MPFLGILEDKKLPHIPGTVVLQEAAATSVGIRGALKHGSGLNAGIVLTPQPSEDPNDPLNWSYPKKLRTFGITLGGTILYGSITSSMLNPAFATIAKDLHTPVSSIVLTSGYFTLVVGILGPMVSALSHKYGKRPLLLFSTTMSVVANIVGATCAFSSYKGLVACKVLQGFTVAPFESLIFAQIADLFFVHERGLYIAIVNFVLVAVANFAAVVSGPIASSLGWHYLIYLMLLFSGIHVILQFFFVPETTYIRDRLLEIDRGTTDNAGDLAAIRAAEHDRYQHQLASEKSNTSATTHIEASTPLSHNMANDNNNIPQPKTFRQELSLYNGSFSTASILQLYVAPFAVVTNTAVLWAVITQSMFLLLSIVVAFVLPEVFAEPPYSLNSGSIGRLSLGPFIGGVISAVIVGTLADPIIKYCAKKNKGIYEPEYRLLPGVCGLLTGAGFMAWGTAVSRGDSVYITATLHGIVLAGVVFMCSAVSGYVIDAYRDMTTEIFIASQTSKNFLIYGFSYFVNKYSARVGVKESFITWGAVALALASLVPLVFAFGKKYRSFWARHNLLHKWHIITHVE